MQADRRAKPVILTLVVFIGVGLAYILVLGASAAPGGIITVCQSGPPACDYGTIQKGIDAAGAGDTVLVSPGAYAGQVTLKSGVTLASSDGPEATTITAIEGPVITATQVASASLQGFTISGYGIVTTSIGLKLKYPP